MDVAQWIRFDRRDVREFEQPDRPASVITNPPYAVRMGEQKEVAALYPVSYTHLDVYKRQVRSRGFLLLWASARARIRRRSMQATLILTNRHC